MPLLAACLVLASVGRLHAQAESTGTVVRWATWAADAATRAVVQSPAGGYDVVAYFTRAAATPGRDEFTHAYQGATFRFATAEHRDAFVRNPERYAPEFGGHCAMALAEGRAMAGDPTLWKVVGGKLYLLSSREALRAWEAGPQSRIREARGQWRRLRR